MRLLLLDIYLPKIANLKIANQKIANHQGKFTATGTGRELRLGSAIPVHRSQSLVVAQAVFKLSDLTIWFQYPVRGAASSRAPAPLAPA
jgi:hypothetical protein